MPTRSLGRQSVHFQRVPTRNQKLTAPRISNIVLAEALLMLRNGVDDNFRQPICVAAEKLLRVPSVGPHFSFLSAVVPVAAALWNLDGLSVTGRGGPLASCRTMTATTTL